MFVALAFSFNWDGLLRSQHRRVARKVLRRLLEDWSTSETRLLGKAV